MIIGYARKSTEDEGSQVQSISDQKESIRQFTRDNGLGKIHKWFEESHSASGKGEERKVFMEMVKFCEKNKGGKIIIYDKSRFGRFSNLKEFNFWVFRLESAGWEILYVNSSFVNDGSIGSEFAELAENFQHSEYSKKLSKDVLRGELSNARKGNWNGGNAPYGYDKCFFDSTGKPYQIVRRLASGVQKVFDTEGNLLRSISTGDRIRKNAFDRIGLVPGDLEHVEVLKSIFDMYVNKMMGARAILIELNRKNIPSPAGGKWNLTGMRKIIQNPVYTGYLVWNRKTQAKHSRFLKGKVQKPKTPSKERLNPESEWIFSENQTHEALVSKEVFEKAQEIRKSRHGKGYSGSGKTSAVYLCSGLIFCKNCGMKLYGLMKKYYLCRGVFQFGECIKNTISRKFLDDLISNRLDALVNQRILGSKEKFFKMILEKLDKEGEDIPELKKSLARKVEEIDLKVSNLLECISPENKDLINEKLGTLKVEKQEVVSRLAGLSEEFSDTPELIAARFFEEVERYFKLFQEGNIKQKRVILRAFIKEMHFDPRSNKLSVFFF